MFELKEYAKTFEPTHLTENWKNITTILTDEKKVKLLLLDKTLVRTQAFILD
jgi:hypothetical protein